MNAQLTSNAPYGLIPAEAGIGLRLPHHAWLMRMRPRVSWIEIHPENYMTGSEAGRELEWIANHYPLSLHAVGLSLGSAPGPDPTHLENLREMVARYQPELVSDHLTWSAIDGVHLPDLLPLPYTEESLRLFSASVERVQSALGRQILIENPSHYYTVGDSVMTEADFLGQLVQRTGCGVLLDVNNLYVSALNCDQEPTAVLNEFMGKLPPDSIGELHLAGHSKVRDADGRRLHLDDHGSRVPTGVWQLFGRVIELLGPRPALIEWDTRLPTFDVLQDEAHKAQGLIESRTAFARSHVCAR